MCINCTNGDGKAVTCCVCEGPLRGGFCLFCDSKAENSFTYDPNTYSFNDISSNFNHLPQPQYETCLCELCGNDSHYGYDCQPQLPFIYEQEPSYNQNYNDNYYPHDSPSFLCCDNCGGSHETFQYQPMNQNTDSSGFDQIQTPQSPEMSEENRHTFFNDNEEHSVQYKEYLENSSNEIAASNFNQEKEGPPQDSDIHQLIREECCIEVCREQKKNMEDTLLELLEISLVHAITPVLRTEEPEYSLSMGYEHLSTNPEMESDEVIKSSVEKLVPILSEYEVTSNNESECDVPVSSTFDVLEYHYEILSYSNDDGISSDDDAFEDIEYVKASPLDSELVSLEEENDDYQEEEDLIVDIESLNDKLTPDRVLNSSASFLIFEESDNSLSNNSLSKFETFRDHTEETKNGSTTAHANNSLPEYDSFCFEIESDQERLTSVVKNDISDDSSNDPLLEEVDLFLALDNSIPSGIENINYDSEGDIYILEELLVDDSIPIPENESSDFDHRDDLSFLVLLRNHRMLSFSLIWSPI
nr:hypothetical protein [Tanacetum cinerariifolium]